MGPSLYVIDDCCTHVLMWSSAHAQAQICVLKISGRLHGTCHELASEGTAVLTSEQRRKIIMLGPIAHIIRLDHAWRNQGSTSRVCRHLRGVTRYLGSSMPMTASETVLPHTSNMPSSMIMA